ncbi:MAG: S-layer homology domain-containing protein, partial [Nodosilinea sp.]
MVNFPPDQPNSAEPTRPVGESSPQGNRILEFDELLAVVLAFIGIGSILWWGIGRSQNLWAGAERLQRRAGDSPAIARPGEEDEVGVFEPRSFPQDEDRPRRGILDSTGAVSGLNDDDRPLNDAVRREAVPVPVAPTTTAPEAETAEASEATQPLDISDVPTTYWAYPFIKPMYDAGYLPDLPDSQFRPDQPLTRAEMAALISQAFGDTSASADLTFSDVSSDYWAASAINNAVAQGFMVGYPDGEFRPQRTIPRYEVIVALASGLN